MVAVSRVHQAAASCWFSWGAAGGQLDRVFRTESTHSVDLRWLETLLRQQPARARITLQVKLKGRIIGFQTAMILMIRLERAFGFPLWQKPVVTGDTGRIQSRQSDPCDAALSPGSFPMVHPAFWALTLVGGSLVVREEMEYMFERSKPSGLTCLHEHRLTDLTARRSWGWSAAPRHSWEKKTQFTSNWHLLYTDRLLWFIEV